MCNLSQNPKIQELDAFIAKINAKESDLIEVLHHAQNLFGYISEELLGHQREDFRTEIEDLWCCQLLFLFYN